MKLTNGQEQALKAISELTNHFPNGGGVGIISGFAGTGKTTVLRTLAEEDELTVLAPTGKAALRVREAAGVSNAMTVHRWLYKPIDNPKTGEIGWDRREVQELEIPDNKTLFVDEGSMVTRQMFVDLWQVCKEAGLNLVVLGDSFQLPPVELDAKYQGWNLLGTKAPAHIRVHMDEIVRQALDSPIIRASMEIRNLRSSMPSLGTDIPAISSANALDHAIGVFNNGGMVICHRNATRQNINTGIRSRMNRPEGRLEQGEPLLVLFNNYTVEAYNGEILTVDSTPQMLGEKLYPVRDRFSNESCNMGFFRIRIRTVTGEHSVLVADREVFGTSGKVSMSAVRYAGKDLSKSLQIKDQEEISGGWVSQEARRGVVAEPILNANLGYALTCHKSQGDQAPDVLVLIEDSIRAHTEEGRRWLYTAATRSERNLTVCWYG